jgi:hypothetical protein
MPYRFRAHIFWKDNSPGHPEWASQQVTQRLTMAFHLNEGAMNEEVSEHHANGLEWTCNVFVPDESKDIIDDFYAHLLAESSRMETKVIEPETEEGETEYLPSWMDVHYCFNDVNQPCHQPYLTFQTPIPDQPEPDNLCETSPAWVSQVWPANSYVKDDNKIWKAKENNTFTWIKPATTGDGAISWDFVKDCAEEPPVEPPPPEEPENPCEGVAAWTNTQHWSTYSVGDRRTDGGKLWECHNPQWAQSYAPSSAWGYLAWTFVADCSI